HTLFVDPDRISLKAVAVQASLIAAGSLDPDIARRLGRHPRLPRRYLAVEGHRALVSNADVLPSILASAADPEIAARSDSPAASLSLAGGSSEIDEPPPEFGVIRSGKILAANAQAARQTDHDQPAHIPRS